MHIDIGALQQGEHLFLGNAKAGITQNLSVRALVSRNTHANIVLRVVFVRHQLSFDGEGHINATVLADSFCHTKSLHSS